MINGTSKYLLLLRIISENLHLRQYFKKVLVCAKIKMILQLFVIISDERRLCKYSNEVLVNAKK